MYGTVVNEEALRARFDVMAIDGEGILIDREGGGVYRLNRTACEIWSAVMAGDSVPEISASIASRFGIARERAVEDARSALTDLPVLPVRPSPHGGEPTGFSWQETPEGYALLDRGVVICEVDRQGAYLRLAPGAAETEIDARRTIRTVMPRVLALRGIYVLHAAALGIDDAATVLTGASGAGKTTTARAFARTGVELISEDLLVLASSPEGCRAVVEGEAAMRSWVAKAAERAVAALREPLPCDGLDRVADGRSLPIATILLLDVDRRTGDRIQMERLSQTSALIALVDSIFVASTNGAAWRPHLDILRSLVKGATVSVGTMPLGLAALDAAVLQLRQSEMTAS
jgi:hypothetical protein